jgi:hypothetical protein
MAWPPRKGDLLPRCDEPEGIEEKLRNYSLVLDHEDGGPKAKGFRDMLGIDLDRVDYLGQEIRTGIARTPISLVRVTPIGSGGLHGSIPDSGTWALQSSNGIAADGLGAPHANSAAALDHRISAKKGHGMSTTRTIIGEHDVVALLNPVGGWPAGTKGTVIYNDPDLKLVEICNEFGEALDELDVPPDQLGVVWTSSPDPQGSVD